MLVFCIGVDYSNIYPVHSVIVAVDKCHRNTKPNPQRFTKHSCSSRPSTKLFIKFLHF